MARKTHSLKLYPNYYKKKAKLGESMVDKKNTNEYKRIKKYNHEQLNKYR